MSISLSTAATAVTSPAPAKSSLNPFTEKAALLRYWNRKIPNSSPHPAFLVSKLTPLSISNAAKFSTLAASDPFKLSSTLPTFCSAAALLCTAFSSDDNSNFTNNGADAGGGVSGFRNYFGTDAGGGVSGFRNYLGTDAGGGVSGFRNYFGTELTPSLASHPRDSAFSSYDNSNSTNNGTDAGGGVSGFGNYFSTDAGGGVSGFRNYISTELTPSLASHLRDSAFSSYDDNSNFTNNSTDAGGGVSGFRNYLGTDAGGGVSGFRNYFGTELTPSLASQSRDSAFSSYDNSNFANNGTDAGGGVSGFRNYFGTELTASLASHPRDSAFSSYDNSNFTNNSTDAGGGVSGFRNYMGTDAGGGISGFRNYFGTELTQSLASHPRDSAFSSYDNSNFTNNSTDAGGGVSGFKNYMGTDAGGGASGFRNYFSTELTPSLASHPRDSAFTSYDNSNFTNNSTDADGGVSGFRNYMGNDAGGGASGFRNYFGTELTPSLASHPRESSFSTYDNSNFTNNNSDAGGGVSGFRNYLVTDTGGEVSGFRNYFGSELTPSLASQPRDSAFSSNDNSNFTNNGIDAGGGASGFRNYFGTELTPSLASEGTGRHARFLHHSDDSNVGQQTFTGDGKRESGVTSDLTSYAHKYSNIIESGFANYGEINDGDTDAFTSYSVNVNIPDNHFQSHGSGTLAGIERFNTAQIHTASMHPGIKQWVEPGKFFRESSLKKGTVMPMPDIHDRTPPRSFLPRSIAGKIPLSASAVAEIFKIPPGTTMAKAVASLVADCERSPSPGEKKQCSTSAEDMIDFAVSVLGSDVEVRSTANTNGSKGNILIGEVKGFNGGNVTQSVSCHQSLFPYLVYYCHSVPRVRVYEAEILAVDSGEKINHGIAICHIDTSDWSPTHGAFFALGPGPGKIEVCHWIFEGDMTWTVRDRV
ncbi:hypothetical protein IEQ34_009417 [Dendrobium chrysotoxum]|uniref:BURP domain-containing protein n=1 Tax=Dendrobium chrysotoxum TaxID=161865 RepID=A0AAV7H0I7_DENCH|nr:hypothetical protein IEQ34_009417 [Dendrobium chrysotoxum]